MARRSSTTNRIDSGISRYINTDLEKVKLVAEHIEAVVTAAEADLPALVEALKEATDFSGITVVSGAVANWNPVTKVLTVPTIKGDKGDAGDSLTVSSIAAGPNGTFVWSFSDGTTYTTPSLKGNKGDKGDKGDSGDPLTVSTIVPKPDGSFVWTFSDGTVYTTPSLKGERGLQGLPGLPGPIGNDLKIDTIIHQGGGIFLCKFSDGTEYITPSLLGPKGEPGLPGQRGLQGISVHHMKGTNTTDPNGVFGTFGELDTYTFYGDADETNVLGWFTVRNGISATELEPLGIMRTTTYDTNFNGIVDNSERLEGASLSDIHTFVTDRTGDISLLTTAATNLTDGVNELDSSIGDLSGLNTPASNVVGAINALDTEIGNIPDLSTVSTNLVGAINELNNTKYDKTGGTVTGSVTINGDLSVNGTVFTVNTEEVLVTDNILVLNNGEVGAGVTNGFAGVEIDRGTEVDYEFGFNETTELFEVGKVGDRQPLLTRMLAPVANKFFRWNDTNKQAETADITWDDVTGKLSDVSKVEAEAGTNTATRFWSSLRVREAILGWWNSSASKTKLDGVETGAQVNVATNITQGTRTTTTVPITSSTGTGATLSAASASLAGVMTSDDKTKLDGIAAGAQVNVATNISQGTRTTTTVPITSSTGSGAALAAASTTLAGVMSSADKTKLDGIQSGAQVNSVTSVAGKTGAVTLVKGDVGLNNVDNVQQAPITRTITAGTGLTGGGDLTADRTLSVTYGTTADTAAQGNDSRLSDAREWTATEVSQAEAETGTATTARKWTAQRVRQAITAWWGTVGTTFGKTLLGSTDAAAARSSLELGTAATRNVGTGAEDLPRNADLIDLRSQQAALDDGLYEASDSGMIFELPTGLNEFDILFVDGFYHLFYDDKTKTMHRQSTTIEGLGTAPDDLTISGRYPSAFFESGTWHLYVWNPAQLYTEHYTSTSASGSYTLQDTLPVGGADFAVAKDPASGTYYATVKDVNAGVTNKKAVAWSAPSLYGPWTVIGPVFQEGKRAGWHFYEEADPSPVFFGGRKFVLFAGWPGSILTARQRIGIVEVDDTFSAIGTPRVLVNPIEDWQIGPQGPTVFSPRILTVDGVTRLFYSQNPGSAVPAGWAYLTYSPEAKFIDRNLLFNGKFGSGFSDTTKVEIYLHGATSGVGDTLNLSGDPEGAVATSPIGSVGEFTLAVEIDAAPSDSVFRRIISLTDDPDSGPCIGLWIDGSGNAYAEVKDQTATGLVLSTTFNVEIKRHTLVLRRKKNGQVDLFVDLNIAASGVLPQSISRLKILKMGNSLGYSTPNDQQFNGQVRTAFYNKALSIDSIKI